jgi:hypothetical protein
MQNLSDYIKVYDDIISREDCDKMIAKYEKAIEHETVSSEIYKFEQLNIASNDNWKEESEMMSNLSYSGAVAYFNELNLPVVPQLHGFEEIRIKKYRPNENERFDTHVDVGDHRSAKRFLAIFCYLNDVDEGGETEFPTLSISIKPKAGRVLIFPPMWMFPHTGMAPLSNNKYIIGTYLHYV